MDVEQLADGLWRWTARHPEWTEDDDWGEEVSCLYYEAPDAIVLFDPLVPEDEAERFWAALDRDVERLGLPVAVLLTSRWHRRSVDAVTARYGEAVAAPTGVEALRMTSEELAYWIPDLRTLVVGDVLVAEDGPLRVCPAAWVDPPDEYGPMLHALAAASTLGVDLVLVSHGEPVLEQGTVAIERAVAHAESSRSAGT